MKDMTEAELDARHAEKMRKKKEVRDRIVARKTIEKGLIIVHTGKGKGKSTAAFGMVFRALGHGMPVAIVQFVKGRWQTGERVALERFGDLVSINTMGEGFTWETQDRQRDLAAARAAWERAKALIRAADMEREKHVPLVEAARALVASWDRVQYIDDPLTDFPEWLRFVDALTSLTPSASTRSTP